MKTWTAHACSLDPGILSEGPLWDEQAQELVWVDITAGLIHRAALTVDSRSSSPGLTLRDTLLLGHPVGAVALTTAGSLLAAIGTSFAFVAADGTLTPIADVPVPQDGVDRRMNDGACDPAGRFLAGTTSRGAVPNASALYGLGADGHVSTLIDDVTISNGLDWSPDGQTLYYVDSPTRCVDALDYDVNTGAISRRRTFATIDTGEPDGLTVDAHGRVWVAIWGGREVRVYDTDGTHSGTVDVGASQVSSCTFAGPNLDILVITTAREGLSAEALASQPDAGRIFLCHTGATGRLPNAYRAAIEPSATVTIQK